MSDYPAWAQVTMAVLAAAFVCVAVFARKKGEEMTVRGDGAYFASRLELDEARAEVASLRSENAALTARAEKAEAELAQERAKPKMASCGVTGRVFEGDAHDCARVEDAAASLEYEAAEMRATISRLREVAEKAGDLCGTLRHPVWGREGFECDSQEHSDLEDALAALSTPETPAAPAEETKP